MKNLLCSSETEIPEVDNTDIPCDTFYSSECVVMQNLSQTVKNYFNLGDTPTLTEYAEAVALALKDARERIITLENTCCNSSEDITLLPFSITTSFGADTGTIRIYQDNIVIYQGDAGQKFFLRVKEGSILRAEIDNQVFEDIKDVAVRDNSYRYISILGAGVNMNQTLYNTLLSDNGVTYIHLLDTEL